jgi:exopolyphosphatase/guanosine-5'-triphosphate,3'-diphosphate pyrophosphatase
MTILGAIDIGSNAMRLAVGKFSVRGELKVVQTMREPVRLGREVFRSGEMTPALMEQAVAAFLKFEKVLKLHKVSIVRAVGTSALRDARNSASFIERVKRAVGIPIEVISGEEEARLVHVAVSHAVDIKKGVSLLIDIGGGSVEISVVDRGNIIFSDSLRMGTVRLLEVMRGRKNSPMLIERLVREYAGGIKRQIQRGLGRKGITRAVGTGGNIETFGNLRRVLLGKTSTNVLQQDELVRITDVLKKLSLQQRIADLKLRPDRADVIMPAGALLCAILKESGVQRLVIPGVGLREGLLIDTYQGLNDQSDAEPLQRRSKQLSVFAREIGARFGFDEKHSMHVAKLGLQIFDQTRLIHRLDGEARVFLELACLLHDIGHVISGRDHHKHSFYIIRESSFLGLTAEQKHLVALIARYHRGSLPAIEHPEWRALDVHARRTVMVCGGIIRLVEELDREHLGRVTSLTLSRRRGAIDLVLNGRSQLLVEKWAATEKKGMLELSLGFPIVIK